MLLFIRIVGVAGAIIFAALLVLLHATPKGFERTAIGFAKEQVTLEVKKRYPALASDQVSTGVKLLQKALGKEQQALQRSADGDLPELVASVISAYCGCTDPAKRKARADAIRKGMMDRVAKLGIAQNQLTDVITGKYDQIISALRKDLTIFLVTNLIAFAAVFGVSFAGREHRGLVVIPGLLLLIAASIASWIYLAEQDWFYSIIFQDYYGWGYAVIMALIFGLLVDIILNRARVCREIASNLPSALIPQC